MISSHIIVLVTGLTFVLSDKSCDRVQIESQWYDKQILWTNRGKPYNLNVHKPTNILFFSFSVPETYSDVDFQLANLNLDTKEYLNIAGIKGGCATAIDHENDEIYLGGSDGIYKYNMITKLADFYKERNKNIWSLFHRQKLFFVSYPEQRLYMEVDGKFAIVREFQNFEIDLFHTTKAGDIYFANNTGMYKYNKSKLQPVAMSDVTVRQFSEDNNDIIYTCTNFGVFIIKDGVLKKILDTRNIHGLTFDKDNNFIISDDRNIMKLVKSNKNCIVDHW